MSIMGLPETRLDLSEPTDELLDYAFRELGENPKTRDQVLHELRTLIIERDECAPHRTDDAFLLRFLRARSFDLEETYKLFVNYYKFKENNPKLFKDVRPADIRFAGEENIFSVPPYTDQNGRRLFIVKIGQWNPKLYDMNDLFKAVIFTLELGILEQSAQILGGVTIMDFEGLSMQHVWQITPSVALKAVTLIHKTLPIDLHAVHIINQSKLVDIIYKLFYPLLDKKQRERIHFHGYNMESLHKHVDPQCLPINFGGVRLENEYKDWQKYMYTNNIVLKEMKSLGYILEDEELEEVLRGAGVTIEKM